MDEPTPYRPGVAEAPAAGVLGRWPAGRSVIPLGRRSADHLTLADDAAAPEPREPLRVLVVEGDDEDFLLAESLLARAEEATFVVERAASLENGLALLLQGGYDACLCDYRLPAARRRRVRPHGGAPG